MFLESKDRDVLLSKDLKDKKDDALKNNDGKDLFKLQILIILLILRKTEQKRMDRAYTYRIVGCIYEVYNELGPGLLESIYERAMIKELSSQGFEVKSQVQVPVYYNGELICPVLRLDLIVDDRLILELKSVAEYKKLFEKQLYTYLRLMNCEMGYVINFNTDNIPNEIHPVFNNHFKESCSDTNPFNP